MRVTDMGLGRQWEERLKIWDEAFGPNFYRGLGKPALEGFVTREHLGLSQAAKGTYLPFPEGTAWGGKWEYGWFRCSVTAPEEAEGQILALHLGVSPEMLVYVNGEEAGSIDRRHAFVQLSPCAAAGERFEIYAEAYAGHGPRPENGGIYPREAVSVPEPPALQCVTGESSFGIWNEEMFQAYADYHTLYELWKALPERSLRAMQVAEALKEFTCRADFELPEPLRTESVRRAREALRGPLEAKNGSSAPVFTVFGQSHLDLAWLWTAEETKRKSARTYANQVALMERYPEYRFLLCEPPILENLKKYYPRLYARVRQKVREGQFIPEGAVWVEGDVNMAGGESLIRQFVLGRRWFREEMGTESRMAWMPDTFGFSGALPQIMKGCGVSWFATQKLLRCDPECQQFPYNLFWWEGIDGTRILSHIYKKNNAVFSPAALAERWERDRNQQEKIDGMLFPFGYGDGGGGPTRIMAEMLRRCADLEGVPRCRVESPAEYFRRAECAGVENVYYGELYLAWHRGTYTANARIKQGVRRAEGALRQAEFLAGILRLCGSRESAREREQGRLARLDAMWRDLLYCQFHDILPGTSIHRVNREAQEMLDRIQAEGLALAETMLDELAGAGAVFNSLGWPRTYQGLRLPACGYARREARSGKNCRGQVSVRPEDSGEAVIENGYYTARINTAGEIVSLRDKHSGYEYAAGPLGRLRMYRDVNVDYDAWELGRMYEQVPAPLGEQVRTHIRRDKDAVCVEVHREEAYFDWRQEIIFAPDSPRIEFRTNVDWRERHKILKVDFPTSLFTREAIEEIQFGYLKRPTHRSRQYEQDLYETCHHRYAALSDGKNGLAVLNDCKYGISARDSTLSLTLLRAPVIPDMEADQGEHTFTYAIYLFDGPFTESNVVREACELNLPVTETCESNLPVMETCESNLPGGSVSYFEPEQKNVILETCKPAMDEPEGVVLRLYECMGSAVNCRLRLPPETGRVWLCNMLEEKQSEIEVIPGDKEKRTGGRQKTVEMPFRAFEIKTLLLERLAAGQDAKPAESVEEAGSCGKTVGGEEAGSCGNAVGGEEAGNCGKGCGHV